MRFHFLAIKLLKKMLKAYAITTLLVIIKAYSENVKKKLFKRIPIKSSKKIIQKL